MANAGTLHDAFLDELRDLYDAEKQITKALPKMVKAASSSELQTAFENHLEETRGHVDRLEQVFESLDEKVRGKHCDGIAGILDEGKSIMSEDFEETTMDACLIGAAQRVEHYEIAAYGTLAAWAEAMGHTKAASLLQQTLKEEKAADEKLNTIAERGINREAASTAHPEDEGERETVGASSGRGGSMGRGASSSRANSSARRR
jgi:ferritin-like metal-binding protein YciE